MKLRKEAVLNTLLKLLQCLEHYFAPGTTFIYLHAYYLT